MVAPLIGASKASGLLAALRAVGAERLAAALRAGLRAGFLVTLRAGAFFVFFAFFAMREL
jgi:hypothetical protein